MYKFHTAVNRTDEHIFGFPGGVRQSWLAGLDRDAGLQHCAHGLGSSHSALLFERRISRQIPGIGLGNLGSSGTVCVQPVLVSEHTLRFPSRRGYPVVSAILHSRLYPMFAWVIVRSALGPKMLGLRLGFAHCLPHKFGTFGKIPYDPRGTPQ